MIQLTSGERFQNLTQKSSAQLDLPSERQKKSIRAEDSKKSMRIVKMLIQIVKMSIQKIKAKKEDFARLHPKSRSVAQFGRAAVSKTAGRGFESSHSCQV